MSVSAEIPPLFTLRVVTFMSSSVPLEKVTFKAGIKACAPSESATIVPAAGVSAANATENSPVVT